MRAAPLLVAFAVLDLVLVGATGLHPSAELDARELRTPLLGIVAVAGAGAVALAGLSLGTRCLTHIASTQMRVAGALAIGLGYGVLPLAFLAWTGLWFTAAHLPVALVGAACAGLILWQGIREALDLRRPAPR